MMDVFKLRNYDIQIVVFFISSFPYRNIHVEEEPIILFIYLWMWDIGVHVMLTLIG
jgi:hypothetical protein